MATHHATISKWRNELLPHIVDHLARVAPDSIYAEYPQSASSYDHGFRPITYKMFANAIDGFAGWLHQHLGPSKRFEVLAYFGPTDIRFPVFVLGAVKAGYTALALSPRNSVEAQKSLCTRLECTKILSADPMPPAARALLDVPEYQHITVPSVEDLLDIEHAHYEWTKTYPEARNDPLFIIHTSGSTGFPKPLTYTHESATRNMNMHSLDPPEGFVSQNRLFQGKRMINMMPPFHGAGLVSMLFDVIPFGTVAVLPLPYEIPTAQAVCEMLKHTTAQAALCVPSIVHEFGQAPGMLDVIASRLKLIMYCGGDLPHALGERIASKVRLRCQYGASEIGITPQILPMAAGPNDWKYLCFPPEMGMEFQEAADGTSELVVKRDLALETTQPSFVLFPEKSEYRTKDLFTQHRRIPCLWTWSTRADDILVFLNGEKTNPNPFEYHIVSSCPEISTAIVVGAQRFQAALLLERADKATELSREGEKDLIEKIWPTIEEANRVAPAHARVEKPMVLVMKPDKPSVRAGKGTLQRGATISQYNAEIDKLYINVDVMPELNGETNGTDSSPLAIDDVVVTIKSLLPVSVTNVTENLFFSLGMDSLGALQLTRKLRTHFGMPQLSLAQVYNHPSVEALARSIVQAQGDPNAQRVSSKEQHEKEVRTAAELFKEEVSLSCQPKTAQREARFRKFILTGSTGVSGSHILGELLSNKQVAHIYCLNRRDNVEDIQSLPDGSSVKGNARVSFLKTSLAEDELGLPHEVYAELLENTTGIIHNAWSVNFNLSFDSFRPQLRGVLNLLKLASNAQHQSRTVFISSVSTVLGRLASTKHIEEKVYHGFPPILENGYAESKWVAELMCDEAASLGLDVSVARVGQIAGPVRGPGVWNPLEWFPSLILSSASMKMLPDSLGPIFDTVNFIPVDLLAEAIVDLDVVKHNALQDHTTAKVWHLQNPSEVEWASLIPAVIAMIQAKTGKTVELVSAQEWLSGVRKVLETTMGSEESESKERAQRLEETVAKVPAVKLVDFYESIMSGSERRLEYGRLRMKQTLQESSCLAKMEAVNASWMQKWMEEWRFHK